MSACCCSLAGTAACRYCVNNPDADAGLFYPPPVTLIEAVDKDKKIKNQRHEINSLKNHIKKQDKIIATLKGQLKRCKEKSNADKEDADGRTQI